MSPYLAECLAFLLRAWGITALFVNGFRGEAVTLFARTMLTSLGVS